ncbi:MAG TPA: tripartite tricarboxylate transporter substrate binding protein [Xanthobacteraceae bacterium]|nr:tripartite tricarboxylate transporter substrate binding protein [Xanthobacteraceae bacterium]
MRVNRRKLLHLAAGAAALAGVSHIARAQAYPSRPVRIMVGFAAGSANDILARLMAQWLSERLGQQFIVETRPGASGNLAAEAVARARPDGYTLLLSGSTDAINATLYDNLNFNFIRDIAPVAGIARAPHLMVVHPSFPANTVGEFIAYAKANPGKITMASAGVGSTSHMSGELFKMMAGIDLLHVPYRGQVPALTDLLGGQVQVDFATMPPSIGYVRSGTLRALAVTSPTRSEALPNVPTVGTVLPGYDASTANGLGVPRNTPAEIVHILNKEINAALADAKVRAHLADLGGTVLPGSPADFGKLLTEEVDKWSKVVKASGAKPE